MAVTRHGSMRLACRRGGLSSLRVATLTASPFRHVSALSSALVASTAALVSWHRRENVLCEVEPVCVVERVPLTQLMEQDDEKKGEVLADVHFETCDDSHPPSIASYYWNLILPDLPALLAAIAAAAGRILYFLK